MSPVRFRGAQQNRFRGQQRAAEILCKDLVYEGSTPWASTRFSRVGLIGEVACFGSRKIPVRVGGARPDTWKTIPAGAGHRLESGWTGQTGCGSAPAVFRQCSRQRKIGPARPTPPHRGARRAVGVRVAPGRKTAATCGRQVSEGCPRGQRAPLGKRMVGVEPAPGFDSPSLRHFNRRVV